MSVEVAILALQCGKQGSDRLPHPPHLVDVESARLCTFHRRDEFIDVIGLANEVCCATLHQGYCTADSTLTGGDDDAEIWILFECSQDQFVSTHPGHIQIRDEDVPVAFPDLMESLLSIGNRSRRRPPLCR